MAPPEFEIDRDEETPIYEQITRSIVTRIESGRLPPGSRLPTVREMAEQLSVARVTVHKAYAGLQERGFVDATVGRGTFVVGPSEPRALPAPPAGPATPETVLATAAWVSRSHRTLSLEIAEPDPSFYPVPEFMRMLRGLSRDARSLLGYGWPRGDLALREQIASLVAERGIDAGPDDLLVTSGSTHALALVTRALSQPGDKVLVEQPTYFGFLALLHSRNLQPVPVPVDDEGPDPRALQRILIRERPRFFYTMPRFQNPMGITMSPARRREILSLAERFGLLLVEDDIFYPLDYDGKSPRPLKSDDRHDLVIYLDSFSKALLPGLRLGYVVAPPHLRERLSLLLQVDTLGSSPLLQRALAEFLRRGDYAEHLSRIVPRYRERRDALLEALDSAMPEGTTWTRPAGGYCCWVTLPEGGSFGDLNRAALQAGVAYTPGEVFLTRSDQRTHMRLCFGGARPGAIRDALGVLGDLVAQRLRRAPHAKRPALKTAPLV